MPLVETLPITPGTAQWDIWSTTARIVVTDPARLPEAVRLVRAELAAVEAAASRFRPDSEVSRLLAAGGRPVEITPRLASMIRAALTAAGDTDGDVDPTVGHAMQAIGYVDALPRDQRRTSQRRGRSGRNHDGDPKYPNLLIFPAPDWREIHLTGTTLTVPSGVLLDLGATAKAWAADRAAEIVARELDTGVLVALGGDIATAGPGDWPVLVRDGVDEPACTITLPAGAALATSSTIARAWSTLHHILDPRSGRPAPRVWRTVSVAAHSCVRANTLTTAAVVRGRSAVAWLRDLGAPARLVDADGRVTTLNAWPGDDR